VDWVAGHDKGGRIVFFPIQNPELLHMAPELGGLALHKKIHGMDTYTRKIFIAGDLWLQMIRRLPSWRWCAFLLSLPGLSSLTRLAYEKRSARNCKIKTEWR
jgi:predicted DCC family thiol-disulfide oxidoreductase YuxK